MPRTDDFPSDISPKIPAAAHVVAVHNDYRAIREEGAPPEIAALLCIAAAIQRRSSMDAIALAIFKDPTRAAGWWRHVTKVLKNLEDADFADVKENAESLFEESLKQLRKQLDK